ncbi:MAG TPA: glycosyltransferase, partial [Candidatus Nitrosocosmicus sp.]|nr:glycosyltransferase [Candidatus Nitrosocosmicus sp.]
EELSSLYKNSKAFLFASQDEEFGMAPVEAMSHGLPVIAYASGGLKETVLDSQNGYLYDSLDIDKLGEAVTKLESLSEEKYLQMRKKARHLSEQYSVENFKKKIMETVDTIHNS